VLRHLHFDLQFVLSIERSLWGGEEMAALRGTFLGPGALAVTIALAGCGPLEQVLGGASQSGPCTLDILAWGPGGLMEPLDPPYVARMNIGSEDGLEANIFFQGTGWRSATLVRITPGGRELHPDEGLLGDGGVWGREMRELGRWTFRIFDRAAGCQVEFPVMVVP
jgi:hypothetical protein